MQSSASHRPPTGMPLASSSNRLRRGNERNSAQSSEKRWRQTHGRKVTTTWLSDAIYQKARYGCDTTSKGLNQHCFKAGRTFFFITYSSLSNSFATDEELYIMSHILSSCCQVSPHQSSSHRTPCLAAR